MTMQKIHSQRVIVLFIDNHQPGFPCGVKKQQAQQQTCAEDNPKQPK
jgi:hypothetical protein